MHFNYKFLVFLSLLGGFFGDLRFDAEMNPIDKKRALAKAFVKLLKKEQKWV